MGDLSSRIVHYLEGLARSLPDPDSRSFGGGGAGRRVLISSAASRRWNGPFSLTESSKPNEAANEAAAE